MSQFFSYDTNMLGAKGNSPTRPFADPFRTYTSTLMPRTVGEMLRWAEAFWIRNSTYSRALKRVIAYFITKVEVQEASNDEKKKYEKFLNDTLCVCKELAAVGEDRFCYGNSFSSCYVPFKRSLRCSQCSIERPIEDIDYKFNKKFKWVCDHCHKEAELDKPIDRRITDETKLKIKRWSPHEIRILHHPISGDKIFLWDPPKNIVNKLLQGDKFYMQYFPWEMVEAIMARKMFEFAPRVIFHMSEDAVAGIRTGGWGIPQTLYNFHLAYYVQQAKMYNEVLMNEFLIPFRVISPAKSGGPAGDPIQNINVGNFNSKLLGMIESHRLNPGGYHALPFPVDYKALSGEGSEFMMSEHIAAATDEMLNAAGVPAELYKGTLQFEALPTALRLFQQTWPNLKSDFDLWLDWLMQTLAQVYNWDRAEASLQPVTLADDVEKRSILLQLLAGNRVSAETALSPMGIDAQDEIKKIFHEQKEQMEEQQKFDQEQQQKSDMQQAFMPQQQGQPGQPGQPQPGGGQPQPMGGAQGQPGASTAGSGGMTPEDIMMQAEQTAQQLIAMPYEQRRRQLLDLKKGNPTLHALVKSQLEQIRSQAASQGGQQVIQQQFGGGPNQQGQVQ